VALPRRVGHIRRSIISGGGRWGYDGVNMIVKVISNVHIVELEFPVCIVVICKFG